MVCFLCHLWLLLYLIINVTITSHDSSLRKGLLWKLNGQMNSQTICKPFYHTSFSISFEFLCMYVVCFRLFFCYSHLKWKPMGGIRQWRCARQCNDRYGNYTVRSKTLHSIASDCRSKVRKVKLKIMVLLVATELYEQFPP